MTLGPGFAGLSAIESAHLRTLLDQAQLTQAEFALVCGVSRKQVSYWTNGHAPVPASAALVAAAVVAIGVEQLLGAVRQVQSGAADAEADAAVAELRQSDRPVAW